MGFKGKYPRKMSKIRMYKKVYGRLYDELRSNFVVYKMFECPLFYGKFSYNYDSNENRIGLITIPDMAQYLNMKVAKKDWAFSGKVCSITPDLLDAAELLNNPRVQEHFLREVKKYFCPAYYKYAYLVNRSIPNNEIPSTNVEWFCVCCERLINYLDIGKGLENEGIQVPDSQFPEGIEAPQGLIYNPLQLMSILTTIALSNLTLLQGGIGPDLSVQIPVVYPPICLFGKKRKEYLRGFGIEFLLQTGPSNLDFKADLLSNMTIINGTGKYTGASYRGLKHLAKSHHPLYDERMADERPLYPVDFH